MPRTEVKRSTNGKHTSTRLERRVAIRPNLKLNWIVRGKTESKGVPECYVIIVLSL